MCRKYTNVVCSLGVVVVAVGRVVDGWLGLLVLVSVVVGTDKVDFVVLILSNEWGERLVVDCGCWNVIITVGVVVVIVEVLVVVDGWRCSLGSVPVVWCTSKVEPNELLLWSEWVTSLVVDCDCWRVFFMVVLVVAGNSVVLGSVCAGVVAWVSSEEARVKSIKGVK